MEADIGGKKLKLVQGDITRIPADAIVNAANSGLAGGGGVDGAIHRAGGPKIMQDLDKVRARIGGKLTPGGAVVTTAGDLPAKWVFHAVGPIYQPGIREQAEVLASCYQTCLRLADERGVRIISFPSISTGAYRYPVNEAAAVAIGAVAEHLEAGRGSVQTALFVLFDDKTLWAYWDVLRGWPKKP